MIWGSSNFRGGMIGKGYETIGCEMYPALLSPIMTSSRYFFLFLSLNYQEVLQK